MLTSSFGDSNTLTGRGWTPERTCTEHVLATPGMSGVPSAAALLAGGVRHNYGLERAALGARRPRNDLPPEAGDDRDGVAADAAQDGDDSTRRIPHVESFGRRVELIAAQDVDDSTLHIISLSHSWSPIARRR